MVSGACGASSVIGDADHLTRRCLRPPRHVRQERSLCSGALRPSACDAPRCYADASIACATPSAHAMWAFSFLGPSLASALVRRTIRRSLLVSERGLGAGRMIQKPVLPKAPRRRRLRRVSARNATRLVPACPWRKRTIANVTISHTIPRDEKSSRHS